MELQRVTTLLTEPFVRAGLYPTSAHALKHIILDYLEHQIAQAKAQCEYYEQTYQSTFEVWSASLADRATPDDEDVWMDWEAARDMLQGWQTLKQQIGLRF